MAVKEVALQSPGSFNDFCRATGLHGGEAVEAYSAELHSYRLGLAAYLGVTIEGLHDMKRDRTQMTTDNIREVVAGVEEAEAAIPALVELANKAEYRVVDIDDTRPWGGFIRFDTQDGDRFVEEFFPGLDISEAHLGNSELELSPKLLFVKPGQRLSWQRHDRRAERWVFLTDGAYHRSDNPTDQGEPIQAPAGAEVQFTAGECHRLVGGEGATLVAEIWQHTNPTNLPMRLTLKD